MPSNQGEFEAASGAAGDHSSPFLLEFFDYQFALTGKATTRDYLNLPGEGSFPRNFGGKLPHGENVSALYYSRNEQDSGSYYPEDLEIYGQSQYTIFLVALSDGTMADGPSSSGGIPLHEFRLEVPPGWAPGLPDYPLRTYFEGLKLWYRVFDGQDEAVGPLVAGRLQGKAQRLGMQLRLPRPDGTMDVGSDALVRLSVEVRDPVDPTIVIQRAIPSGVQALSNALRDAFGLSDRELVIEWDARLEEATTRAGLDLNDMGKFYLFFRGAGLPYKFVEDIKLQLQGDLRRFQEARGLALRLSTRKDGHGDSFYQDHGDEDGPEPDEGWLDSYWADDGWSWVESPKNDYWTDDTESYYDYDLESWYEADEGWSEMDYDFGYEDHPDYHNETAEQAGKQEEATRELRVQLEAAKGAHSRVCPRARATPSPKAMARAKASGSLGSRAEESPRATPRGEDVVPELQRRQDLLDAGEARQVRALPHGPRGRRAGDQLQGQEGQWPRERDD